MVTTVKTLIAKKNIKEIVSVSPDNTVIEALEIMAKYNIGVVVVLESNRLVGIFSERDYARKGILKGRKAKTTSISEVMTPNVYTVKPEMNIIECMEIMSEHKFRHLPVVDENGTVTGVLSVGDIVTTLIIEQKQTINFLEQYIAG